MKGEMSSSWIFSVIPSFFSSSKSWWYLGGVLACQVKAWTIPLWTVRNGGVGVAFFVEAFVCLRWL
jgi:hypothetical protein